jgi:hypothetical protein
VQDVNVLDGLLKVHLEVNLVWSDFRWVWEEFLYFTFYRHKAGVMRYWSVLLFQVWFHQLECCKPRRKYYKPRRIQSCLATSDKIYQQESKCQGKIHDKN